MAITAGTATSRADLGRVVVIQVVAARQLDLVNQVGELPRQPCGVNPAQACRDPAREQGRVSGKTVPLTALQLQTATECLPARPLPLECKSMAKLDFRCEEQPKEGFKVINQN